MSGVFNYVYKCFTCNRGHINFQPFPVSKAKKIFPKVEVIHHWRQVLHCWNILFLNCELEVNHLSHHTYSTNPPAHTHAGYRPSHINTMCERCRSLLSPPMFTGSRCWGEEGKEPGCTDNRPHGGEEGEQRTYEHILWDSYYCIFF